VELTTLKIAGRDAIRLLNEYRSRYATSGQYPFLIGDSEELGRIKENAEFNEQDPARIIRASLRIKIAKWIAGRRKEAEEYEFSPEEMLGEWPGEILEKGSIDLHKEVLSGKVKPGVYLGLAKIEKPWHLPAILKYGAWNECPEPEVHCAFHREWQERFGAEITGMSGDVVECAVRNPPADRKTATILAWEQYWYCPDIVEQGCGSVSNLAATLLNSHYWYFWWD
jgi:Domain of unknown function (DUF4253)